ncbi:T9SS type A sorting domain-containing protein [Carboxylicivirga marina]|uniref:T9SS type A sorting domain-containing protein n=1 Tax=Carboxylicivirga marina TaxID=2800988 RepID=A0ABS1HHH4_9BACT|nr:T9SS type A sorting domain-containing protein [Carboxylicivirga marina]MBK3517133.1 T9SS type A sorting domain-containing protein [Carboxylicivirga marina]
MKKLFTLLTVLMLSIGMTLAQSLPLDFESDYGDNLIFGDGGQGEIVGDPAVGGSHGQVLKYTENGPTVAWDQDGPKDWQHAKIILADNYIDLTGANKTVTLDVYTTVATGGLLKLESSLNGGGDVEVGFSTLGNGWESISLDFSTTSANDEYLHVVFLPGYGGSNGITDEVFYFDNITGPIGSATTPDPVPVNLLNDFDGASVCAVVETMGAPAPTFNIVDDPAGGTNQVFEFVKPTTSGWNHWDRIHFELNESIEIIGGKAAFSIKAYSPAIKGFLLKIADDADSDNAPNKAEIWQDVTQVNTWETLTYVFTGLSDAEYKHVFIYPAGGDGDLNSYFIDDVKGPNLKSATAIAEANVENLTIYPNPATDILNITSAEEGSTIEVYGINGVLVKQAMVSNGLISVAELQDGIYFVKVGDLVTKLVKR